MLEIQNIHKTFGRGTADAKEVFRGLSLHLAKGEFVTIVGSNGAGKSTLFNLVAGSFYPDKGCIQLDGQNVTWQPDYKRSRHIGRLFQDPLLGTVPHMTIEENLALVWLSTHKSGAMARTNRQDREFFCQQLARLQLGLEKRLKSPVGLLSGGQRQALTLLMATLRPPKLLLLDEHTASLDPATAEKVLAMTRQVVVEHGITCMMITHSLQAALELGSRTLMMDEGRIVLDIAGPQRAAMTVPALMEAFRENAKKALVADRVVLGAAL